MTAEAGLRLDELARELPGPVEIAGDAAVRVTGVRHDSREVAAGDLFVARKGARADGAAYVAAAIERGAPAVMLQKGGIDARGLRVPVLMVDDVVDALAFASAAVYGHPAFSLEIVGVTGTNGKTTVTHLVRAMIDGAAFGGRPRCGVIGTIGHRFGDAVTPAAHTTPEADEIARVMAKMRDDGAEYVAMEVSSHALALRRVRAVRFRVAAFTNLTQDHHDFHGSMKEYAEAKSMLFTGYAPGAAVINVDDPFGAELAKLVRAPLTRVSSRPGADAEIAPREARVTAEGIEATLATPEGDVRIVSRLVGAHNLENLVVAMGIASALELDLPRAAAALAAESGAPGRLERCDERGDDIVVLVDYAHTPDALSRVLDAVRAVATGRVWCVFGCGGDRDPTKREPMGQAAGSRADVAIVTNDNPRSEDPSEIARAVAKGVRRAGKEPVVELDRRAAIARAVSGAAAGDAVLIAGKGHEDYQLVGAQKLAFDDRVEARRALAARRGAA
jgi:UDP-N-acetylmuramoyl-L-alanyl-D-glutamate--2,6-diaminopimelate ligase